jgi:hypothetical protein
MPNQRSKDKTYIGGYVDKRLFAKIERLAKREGMEANRFGFVTKLVLESLDKRDRKTARKQPRKKG